MINEKNRKKVALINQLFFSIFANKTITLTLRATDLHAIVFFLLFYSCNLDSSSPEKEQLIVYAEAFIKVLIGAFPESKPVYEEFKKHINSV